MARASQQSRCNNEPGRCSVRIPGRSIAVVAGSAVAVSLLVTGTSIAPSTAAASPERATITRSDFLKNREMKALANGSGRWVSSRGKVRNPLETRPQRCRPLQPFARYQKATRRSYGRAGNTYPIGVTERSATTTVIRYRGKPRARAAMRRFWKYPKTCARSVEIFCRQCDGVHVIKRAARWRPNVGTRAAGWRQRFGGIGFTLNQRWIAARHGRTIVLTVVTATKYNDFTPPITYPRAPSKAMTTRIARASLARAT